VGPFTNPSETYQYYSLPFCAPGADTASVRHDLGEHLSGDRKVLTPYDIRFRGKHSRARMGVVRG
jgi:hypothetical protein